MKTSNLVLTLVAIVAFSATAARAVPITVPTDLNVGDKYRLVFVTSTTRDGTSSSISDYNDFVTTAANTVAGLSALGTTWRAIVSTGFVDARDNTGTNPSSTGNPVYRLDDTRIADDNADLWDGSLQAAIQLSENAQSISDFVWTGTAITGVTEIGLGGATVGSTVGFSGTAVGNWIDSGEDADIFMHNVYAMSDVLTVVPEPGTITLAGMGLIGLFAYGWRRRRRA